MIRILLFFICFLSISNLSIAQTEVELNIFHKLGDVNFEPYLATENNLGHDFDIKRLEYYISQISLIHDGGTETQVEDMYILADASLTTSVVLGNFDVTQLDAIRFYIGVDEPTNHSDPSSWQSPHPLAPQSPSMHWGWAAGFRFIALEGKSGSALNQDCQIHGLGDENYFQTEVLVDFAAGNNDVLTINLDADYIEGLRDISLNSGIYNHGTEDEAAKLIENFRDYVFSPSATTTATVDFSEVSKFEVYPNPATDGNTTIALTATEALTYQVSVTDVLGKQIAFFDVVNSNTTLDLPLKDAGFYLVSLIKEGQAVITKS